MVHRSRDPLGSMLSALADRSRRAMYERLLCEGELTVTELAEPLGISLPGVAKHVKVLEHAGLLEHHKVGRSRRCTASTDSLDEIGDWLDRARQFWMARLDELADYAGAGD